MLRARTTARSSLILLGYLHDISNLIDGDGVKFLKDLGLPDIADFLEEYQYIMVALDFKQFPGVNLSLEQKQEWNSKRVNKLKYGQSHAMLHGAIELAEKESNWMMDSVSLIPGLLSIPSLVDAYFKEIEEMKEYRKRREEK